MNKKVGRNDPCPCGSGKKYKACCMHKQQESARYTPSGKRKFKATLLSGQDKGQSIFNQAAPQAPEGSGDTSAFERWKYKMTQKDYRSDEVEDASQNNEEEEVEAAQDRTQDLPAPDEEFNSSDIDYRDNK